MQQSGGAWYSQMNDKHKEGEMTRINKGFNWKDIETTSKKFQKRKAAKLKTKQPWCSIFLLHSFSLSFYQIPPAANLLPRVSWGGTPQWWSPFWRVGGVGAWGWGRFRGSWRVSAPALVRSTWPCLARWIERQKYGQNRFADISTQSRIDRILVIITSAVGQ